MTLSEQFPKATLELPLEIRHEFNIFTATGRLLAGTGGTSSNVQDTYSQNVDNAKAINHAVSTYDSRDDALSNALDCLRLFRDAGVQLPEEWPTMRDETICEIESALAVQSGEGQ